MAYITNIDGVSCFGMNIPGSARTRFFCDRSGVFLAAWDPARRPGEWTYKHPKVDEEFLDRIENAVARLLWDRVYSRRAREKSEQQQGTADMEKTKGQSPIKPPAASSWKKPE